MKTCTLAPSLCLRPPLLALPGFGLRQSSGAFERARLSQLRPSSCVRKRCSSTAVQDAGAVLHMAPMPFSCSILLSRPLARFAGKPFSNPLTAMKTKLTLLFVVLLPLAAHAADDLTSALQKGLFEEEANQNLPAAIKAYESLLAASDEQRKLAATALFRLGECYRKLGKTNDAVTQYQRLLRDYADQGALATLSRQNLAGLGAGAVVATTAVSSQSTVSIEFKELVRTEEILAQLSGWDLGQVRRLLPTVSPDADFERYDRLLIEAQEKGRTLTGEARDEWRKKENDYTLLLQQRFDQIKGLLTERAEQLRARVAIQNAAALKQQAAAGASGTTAPLNGEEQEIRRIQALIKDSPDLINAAGKDRTPLHVAAAEGKLAIVRFLLDSGAKPDVMTTDNQGPALWLAAENGHKAVVELLLTRGADPNIKDGAALQAAAANGFMGIVDVLLANKADINLKGHSGTALHRAVYMKRTEIAERLLKSGADVNALGSMGETPLHIAARRADVGMIRLLIGHKADINAKDRGDAPPLWRVWDNLEVNMPIRSQVEAARTFLESGAAIDFTVQGQSPVHGAFRLNSVELVELLLKFKAAPDLPNRDGLTPIQVIALRRRDRLNSPGAELISKLVSAGANPNRPLPAPARAQRYDGNGAEQSYGGYPPLCAAISRGDQEVVEALLESGADVNGFVRQGQDKPTALMLAVDLGTKAMVDAVLRYKPDLESRRETDGRAALHQAAAQYAPSPEVIDALAKAGANANAADNKGWTPLHIAVEGGHPTAVKALLEAGANPNAMTASGAVPLSIARSTQGPNVPSTALREELVQLLLKQGADELILRRRNIVMTRRSANYEEDIFRRGTNSFNRFSLYELIARLYPRGGPLAGGRQFPDLRQVAIDRISDDGGTIQLLVDVESRASSESCTNDLWLEWGDRIEIREKEHALNASWAGLDGQLATNISGCISRSVDLVIKGRTNHIELKASAVQSGQTTSRSGGFENGFQIAQTYPGLAGVLRQSGLLLTTSDLSRVRVTRRDPAAGKSQEWILDETKVDWSLDFWLRDGDVIEVPEK